MSDRRYSAKERAEQSAAGQYESDSDKEERIPEFPAECLPPILEKQARGIADLCGVPLAMSAPMVLAVASISIGKGLRVRSLKGRITPANIYVLVCKTSGSGGSLTFKYATAPLIGRQQALRREFEQKVKPHIEAERAAVSSQIEELKRRFKGTEAEEREEIVKELAQLNEKLAEIEKRAVGPLLYVTDVTPEKLAEMLAEQGETLAHIDSDAADALGIITGMRYGDGKHTQDTTWLKGYSGEPTVIFRKNGKPLHLTEPWMAVLFLATPDKVQELFRIPRLTSGGLLPRFLVCDPGARPVPLDASACETTHTLPGEVSQPYEAAIFAAIHRYRFCRRDDPDVTAIDPYRFCDSPDPDEINLTPAALRLFADDWNRFCKVSNGTEDSPFEARHTENAIRLALVLHVYKHVELKKGGEASFNARMRAHEHPVDEQTARDALRIRDWFTLHQEALRTPQRAAADDAAWDKAEAMLRHRPTTVGITARDLYRGHRVCGDAAAAGRLLALWESEGRLASFERKPEGAGRPTTAYRLARGGPR